MRFDSEVLISRPFYISLIGVTLVYFVGIRFFQDWLYRAMGIDQRPEDMFLSFGPKFSQAEPFEIVLYLLGYVVAPAVAYMVAPAVAYMVTPLVTKLFFNRHPELDSGSRQENQKQKEFKSLGISFGFLDSSSKAGMTKMVIGILAVFGVIVGIALLKFPFSRFIEYIQTNTIGHVLWFIATKRIIVTYLLLAMSAVFFVGYYWFQRRDRKLKKWETRLERYWPIGLIVLAILIFNPNFPIDDHHSNYFVGSVHEVYQGKALLYESSNLYGLFSIYFLLALFKLIPLTFTSFTAVIMAVYMVFFSGLWVFIRKWLNSALLATLALIPIVAIMYFFQTSPTRSALFFPAMSPFRWGLYVIVLFLMLGYERTRKGKYLHWSLFVAAFSLFWNFDSGLFLSAAALGTVGYLKLTETLNHLSSQTTIRDPETNTKTKRLKSFGFLFSFLHSSSPHQSRNMRDGTGQAPTGMTLKKIFAVFVEYFSYVIGLFAVTSVVNRLIYDAWPQWELFFRENKYFRTGIAMYPLPKIGVYEILFFVYAVVLVLMFYSVVSSYRSRGVLQYARTGLDENVGRNDRLLDIPLVFLALYGVFSFIYYIGESSWQVLYVVVVPFILIVTFAYHNKGLLTFFAMAKNVSKLIADDDAKEMLWQERLIRSGFATVIFFGVALLAFKLPVEFSVRNYQGIAERFSLIDPADQHTYDDAQYLAGYYPQYRIPVMSLNDTKLMMYSGKVNWFDFYYIFTIYFRQQMQRYVDEVLRKWPQYILVGKGEYRNDQVDYFLNGVKDVYSLKESLNTIDVYQLKTAE